MYHSILFGNINVVDGEANGDKNTWADWYLIPESRPVFNPPNPKTNYVDLPGTDWHLDLSTVLTGDIAYEARTGSIEFIVDNGQYSDYDHKKWAALYSDLLGYLHGKLLNATLEDDLGFYYQGRFSVNTWKSDPENSKVTIDYVVSPFKYEQQSSLEDWKWDTFSFEHGIIREYKDIVVNNSLEFVIYGRRMSVVPSFKIETTNGKGMKVVFNGTTYTLPEGTSRVVNIKTVEGENTLKFIGNGTISIDYRGGCL